MPFAALLRSAWIHCWQGKELGTRATRSESLIRVPPCIGHTARVVINDMGVLNCMV